MWAITLTIVIRNRRWNQTHDLWYVPANLTILLVDSLVHIFWPLLTSDRFADQETKKGQQEFTSFIIIRSTVDLLCLIACSSNALGKYHKFPPHSVTWWSSSKDDRIDLCWYFIEFLNYKFYICIFYRNCSNIFRPDSLCLGQMAHFPTGWTSTGQPVNTNYWFHSDRLQMRMSTEKKMAEERRKARVPAKVPLTEINEYLMCQLCIGYLIDATAIIECQHTCKSFLNCTTFMFPLCK